MKVDVIVFPDIVGSKERPRSNEVGDIKDLCPSTDLLPGFEIVGGHRKFMMFVGDEQILVAIGPRLSIASYIHHRIVEAAKESFGHLRVAGGGRVIFTNNGKNNKWSAKFYDRSGDYGLFDLTLFHHDVRRYLANELGMEIVIEASTS